MTDTDRLRALELVATSRPWWQSADPDHSKGISSTSDPHAPLCFGHDYDDYGEMSEADRRLIIETRNALPALLDELDALRKVRDAARRYRAAEEDLRIHFDEPVNTSQHNARVTERRVSNFALRAALAETPGEPE